MERVGDLDGVGQHRVRDRPVGTGQIEGDPLDRVPPLLGPSSEPFARRRGVTARYDVEQLPVADKLG
jgi:hypothetical protein